MRARQPRTRTSAWTGSALAALIALATPAAAQTESPADFYRGKTVKIIVGFGVGGGYDTYARMLAPYLREQLKTTVIVENQPGAGGLSALNRLYAAPPDGLQLMLISGIASTLSQLVEQGEVRYDLSKVGHLGIVSASPWMWLGGQQSPIRTARRRHEAGRAIELGRVGPDRRHRRWRRRSPAPCSSSTAR